MDNKKFKYSQELENRLDRVSDIHTKLKELLDNLPDAVPDMVKNKIIDALLGNKDLQKLTNAIKERRAPRFILVGRTGAGKSSLINALFGKYLVMTSDVVAGTKTGKKLDYKLNGKVVFEFVDTRGTADLNRGSEKALMKTIENFEPDGILFVVKAKDRAHLDKDMIALKSVVDKINEHINQVYNMNIPLFAVINASDELEPARQKNPKEYDKRKIENIEETRNQIQTLFKKHHINALDIIPVSSYIEWDCEGNPADLKESERNKLKIEFDGRYKIDTLLKLIDSNIDLAAAIYMMMIARVDFLLKKIADRYTLIFASASSVVALTPIPISDIFILIALQVMLTMLIGYLGGRDLSWKTAKEFLTSMGLITGVGAGLRWLAQQGSKFLNTILPGSGSAISASIAYSGTYAIGKSATAYFIEGLSKKEIENNISKYREAGAKK